MLKIVDFESIASLALLYLNKADENCNMLSLNKAKKFEKIVNENIIKMQSQFQKIENDKEPMHIYFYATNISDKKYLVINPSINISEAFNYYISIIPSEVLKASQMPNALAILKIKLVNEKFVKELNNIGFIGNERKKLMTLQEAISKYNNFNKEIEEDFKQMGIEGGVKQITLEDKATPEDYANLERKITLRTESNRTYTN